MAICSWFKKAAEKLIMATSDRGVDAVNAVGRDHDALEAQAEANLAILQTIESTPDQVRATIRKIGKHAAAHRVKPPQPQEPL